MTDPNLVILSGIFAQFLNNLPAPNSELDRLTFLYLDLNFSGADITPLIDLRRQHQTKQAESNRPGQVR